jgi:hypothetical protein
MNDRNRPSEKQLIGYAGCAIIAAGCFLPFRHAMFRDVNAFASGQGFVVVVLAGAAAYFISARRFLGASFCAAAVIFLLALQYVAIAHLSAVSSLIWDTNWGTQSPIDPTGLAAHADIGLYTIAIGAIAVIAARLYPGSNASVQNVGGSTDAGSKRNGRTGVDERELDRGDRAE